MALVRFCGGDWPLRGVFTACKWGVETGIGFEGLGGCNREDSFMRKTLVLLIVVLALVGAGCLVPADHVTGGGFIEGADEGTANFGFNVKCAGEDTKGHLTYHDGDIKIKGTIDACKYVKVERVWTLKVMGDWVPQGKTDLDGGRFAIMGTDEGEPGIGDEFTIKLKTGIETVYENSGELLGGNIQVHE
jgi:hypothetical protein